MHTVRSSVVQQQAAAVRILFGLFRRDCRLAVAVAPPGTGWFDAIRTLLFQASSHRRGGGQLDHVHRILGGRGVRVTVDVEGDARISESDLVAE
jgi:hypothetical protein